MKDTKKNAIVLLLITAIILYFLLKDEFLSVVEVIRNVNIWWLLLATLGFLIYLWFKAITMHLLAKRYSSKVNRKNLFTQTLIIQFFNGITPFSTGGQPMEVYLLKKKGIKIATATNIIVQNFILYQLALITYGVIALFLNGHFHLFTMNNLLHTLILLGFIINIAVGIILLFISFSTKFNNFVGTLVIKLATKVKIVKNREKVIEKWHEKLEEFHSSALLLKKEKMILVKGYLYNLIGLTTFYLIPFFVVLSFGLESASISILVSITGSAYVLLIGNFVPIPGGSGGIEWGFLELFGRYLSTNVLSATLILWRFITYYASTIIGGILFSITKGDVKK